ncbi:MAG: NADH-quinone oxidoreductase subunit N [Chloroflexota bacterium]
MNISLLAPEIVLTVWACMVLLVSVFLPAGTSRRPLLYLAVLGVFVTLGAVITLIGRVESSFSGALTIDSYAIFFKILFLVAAALVLLASETFTDLVEQYEGEFYAALLFCTAGFMLMASSTELMSIYVSLELTSLSLAFLASWAKRDLRSSEAGLKFFVLSAMSSAILLFGMALLYGVSGATTLTGISNALSGGATSASLLALSMIIAGFGFKISAVPFQMWTPDVYEGAPTPVTAFLSVASKAAGFAVILRILAVALPSLQADWSALMAVLAALTMTFGNLAALVQSNVKRLLAYSSIAHVGYMLMGPAVATQLGFSGVLYYLLAYTLTNVAAFTVIIMLSRYIPDEDLEYFSGLGRRAPLLAFTLSLALLSLAGLPPLVGFFSKLYLFWAVAERGLYWLLLLGVVNSAISLYYYTRVIRQMYLVEPSVDKPVIVDVAPALSLLTATTGVVLVGVLSGVFIPLAVQAASAIIR